MASLAATASVSALVLTLGASAATAATAAPVGPGASSASTPDGSTWFVDPLTPKERGAQVAVPANPKEAGRKAAGAKLVQTRAAYRTAGGDLAVPMSYVLGHTLAAGQALTLDKGGLFVIGTTHLTRGAEKQLRGVAVALSDAASITCEGNADYGSTRRGGKALADGRAQAVCGYLASLVPGLETVVRGYGFSRPAVIGGRAGDRDLNRRVVIDMTAAVVPAPAPVVPVPAPTTPVVEVPAAPTVPVAVDGEQLDYPDLDTFEIRFAPSSLSAAHYELSLDGTDWMAITVTSDSGAHWTATLTSAVVETACSSLVYPTVTLPFQVRALDGTTTTAASNVAVISCQLL